MRVNATKPVFRPRSPHLFLLSTLLAMLLLANKNAWSQTNIALGKTVTSSSSAVAMPASNLTDGNLTTVAGTANVNTNPNAEWFEIDLGSNISIENIRITSNPTSSARGRRFIISTWPSIVGLTGLGADPNSYTGTGASVSIYNRIFYTQATTGVGGPSVPGAAGTSLGPDYTTQTINFGIHSARYIRILALNDEPLELAEFEVFRSTTVPERVFINGSFEQGATGTTAGLYFVSEANADGWNTTEGVSMITGPPAVSTPANGGLLEIWRSPFQGATANQGNYLCELNSFTNSALSQNPICVLAGESFTWSFAHRGRSGVDVMRLLINGVDVAEFSDNNASTGTHTGTVLTPSNTTITATTPEANGWTQYTGTWTNTTGAAQTIIFTFRAVSSSAGNVAAGNLLDDVSLTPLSTLLTFSSSESFGPEHIASANLPLLLINGTVGSGASVQLNITGGTATRSSDYTTSPASGAITIPIPAGTYDGTAATGINLAPYITIQTDLVNPEPDETIIAVLQNPSAGMIVVNSANSCSVTGSDQITYTIQNTLPVTIAMAPTHVSCFNGNNGSATATVTGGSGSFIYSWNTTPVQTTATITNLSAGNYTLTVIDTVGKDTATAVATINQPAALASTGIVTPSTGAGQSDGAINMSVTGGTSPYTFSWSNGAATEDVTAIAAGTYMVNITDSKNCIAKDTFLVLAAPVAINVTDTPVISNQSPGTTIDSLKSTDLDGTVVSYTIVTLPPASQGVLTLANGTPIAAGSTITLADARALRFVPNSSYVGPVNFTFTATDNDTLTDATPATYTLNVGAPPIAINVTSPTPISNQANGTTIAPLNATDSDGTISSYTVSTLPSPSQGVLTLANGSLIAAGQVLTPAEAAGIKFTAASGYTGPVNFTFTATDNHGFTDATPANYTLNVVRPASDLAITKTAAPKPAVAGEGLTYTINLVNNGPGALNALDSLTLTDNLPAGFTATGYTASNGTYTSANGIWTGLTLATGQSATVSIAGNLSAAATGSLINTATLTLPPGITDPVPTNNTAKDTTAITAKPVLTVTKTGQASLVAGNIATYTIVVRNIGSSNAVGATITDAVPAGFSAVSWTSTVAGSASITTGATGTGNNVLLNANIPAGAGNEVTITVKGTLSPSATGNITNTATATPSEPSGTPGTSVFTSTVTSIPGLSIAKTAPAQGTAGGTLSYTIEVGNNGPSNATGSAIRDTVAAQLSNVSWTAQAAGSATVTSGAGGSGNIIAVIANIPAGTANKILVNITGTVSAGFIGQLNNTAFAIPQEPGAQTVSGTANTNITATPVLTISKIGPAEVIAGETIQYILSVKNTGLSNSTGTLISDAVPSNVGNVSWAVAVVSGTVNVTAGATGTGNNVAVTANLNANSELKVTVTGTVNAAFSGSLTNNGIVKPAEPGTPSDTSVVVTTVNRTPSLTIQKNGPATIKAGQPVTYTITVANKGTANAIAAVVTDTVPAGIQNVTWSSTTTGSATVTAGAAGNTSLLSLTGNIPAGAGNTIIITVNGIVDPASTANIVNTATVTPSEPGTPLVPSPPVTTVVTLEPNISLYKSGPDSAFAGQQITYQVEAINNGPSNATGLVITDVVPAGLTNVSWTATATGGSSISSGATGTGSNVSVTAGLLAGGTNKVSITITATIPPGFPAGMVLNSATATPSEPGIPPVHSDTVSTVVTNRNNLSISKSGPPQVSTGETVTYTLTVQNAGPSNAVGAVITDAVPAGLINVAWTSAVSGAAAITAGANGSGNAVSLTGNLPSGSSNTILVTITGLLNQAYAGTSIINSAIATPSEPGNPPVNSDTITTQVAKRADLKITKTGPQTAAAGESVVYTLTVSNAGPSNVSGAAIQDIVPADIINTTWTAVAQGAATVSAASGAGNAINFTANLPATSADFVTITINGTISPTFTGSSITNTATAAPPTGVTDPTPATSTVVTQVSAIADVRISKTAPSNAGAGEAIAYQLRITNDGLSTATGTTISDNIHANITGVTWSVTLAGGATASALSGTGNAISFLSDIPKGAVVTVNITGTLTPGLTNGANVPNTATATVNPAITDVNPADNTTTVNTVIDNNATFRVSKAGPGMVKVGDPITYTILVENVGAGDITAADIEDLVPDGVLVSSWSATGTNASINAGFPSSGTVNAINTQAFLGGSTGKLTIIINGTVAADAPASFTNTASVTAGGNRQASVTTAVNQSTDLAVSKTGPTNIAAGSSITYIITARNLGAVSANGVIINDIVPGAIQNPTWSAVAAGMALINSAASGTGNVTLNADIPVGSTNTITITVTGTIPANASPGIISNTAALDISGTGLTDNNRTNNTATLTTNIVNEPALVVQKSGPSNANGGELISYTVSARNNGVSDATGVRIIDLIPGPVNNVTWSAVAQGSAAIISGATGTGNSLELMTNIPAGATNTILITITGKIQASFRGTIVNTATASVGSQTVQSPAVTTIVQSTANLGIVKNAPQTVIAGQPLTYTIQVDNYGPSSLAGSAITDNVPAILTNVSWSGIASGGAVITSGVTGTGNNLSMVADLPVSGRIVISVTGSVPPNASGDIRNFATITPKEPGIPPVTSDAVITTVVRKPNLAFSKIAPTAASSGESISFTLKLTNAGPSNALNTAITDNMPAGLTNVSWTATATNGASIVSGTAGTGNVSSTVNVPVGGEVSVVVNGTISRSFTGNLVNTATATPAEPGIPAIPATTTTIVSPKVDIVITKSGPAESTAGQGITYQIRVRNNGPSTAASLAIADVVAASIQNVQWTATATGGAVINSGASGSGNNIAVNVNLPSASADEILININGVIQPSFTGTVTNTATATPTEPGSTPASSIVTTTVARIPLLTITKTGNAVVTNNGTISYRIIVTNTSSSNALSAVISDAVPTSVTSVSWVATVAGTATIVSGAGGSGNAVSVTANIPAGAANAVTIDITGTVSATVTGYVVNQARVTPSEPGTVTVSSESVKTAIKPTGVTDTGITPVNTPVTIPVKVNDPNATGYNVMRGAAAANGSYVVNPDGTVTYTPANGFAGVDSFTYRLQTPDGVLSDPITVRIIVYTASFTVTKVANNTGTKAGDVINYTLRLTNTGQSVLTNLVVTDPGANPGSISPATVTTLAVGGTANVTASHTLTQAEVDAGRFSNQASARGVDQLGNPVTAPLSDDPATPAPNDPTVIAIAPAPAVTLVKTVSISADGRTLTYTFTIRNSGNVTLSNIRLSDAKLGMNNEPVPGTLAPGASTTFTRPYSVTPADADAGTVTNTATVSSQSPGGINATDISGTAVNNNNPTTITVPPNAAISLLKTGALAADGATITYTFTISNTGNVTLTNFTITDTKLGISNEPVPGSLAPGASTTFTRTYTLVPEDFVTGRVTNTATVSGRFRGTGTVTDVSGTTQANDLQTVTEVPPIEIFIPNVITANGDGMNDRFVIKGLNRYPGSGIFIYNRWGNMVYQHKNYDNTWDGKGLNEGTYYYILKLKTTQGEKMYKGWVEILR